MSRKGGDIQQKHLPTVALAKAGHYPYFTCTVMRRRQPELAEALKGGGTNCPPPLVWNSKPPADGNYCSVGTRRAFSHGNEKCHSSSLPLFLLMATIWAHRKSAFGEYALKYYLRLFSNRR